VESLSEGTNSIRTRDQICGASQKESGEKEEKVTRSKIKRKSQGRKTEKSSRVR
jgi:hypothetical protein